ncbi:MAG TPA: DUF6261 family protein [Prolixibacteraceae bacterium]|nr:DUF6261 family protein [Prolixibacteraceae bacterium]
METKINRLQLKNLWNSEYTIFVNQVVGIVVKYNPEALHLQKAFEKLLNVLPNLEKVKAQELSNALSTTLQELDNDRSNLIKAIFMNAKILGRLRLISVVPNVVVLKRFLKIHGRDIATANYNSASKRTSDLLTDYESKAEVKMAVEALSLKMLFDQLNIVNTQFINLFLQRTEEESAAEKIDSRAIRTETNKILYAFFNAFEFCSSEYNETDYTTPANELNELIDFYKTQLKARATRSKAGEDVSKEPAIV